MDDSLVYLLTILVAVVAFFRLPYQIILSLIYRPVKPNDGYRPSVSIVIPVYNEGRNVKSVLLSAINSKYSGEKEVICVDDGSTDDTAIYINQILKECSVNIKFIQLDENRGKREALAAGFRASTGEIIITIDSDTIISEDAIEHIVAPFQDQKIGAVTGLVKTFNKKKNLLTKMARVNFVVAYEFTRAARSVIGSVMVCSGAFSAYRREILLKIIDEWLNEKFLGCKVICGDDRALTNLILKSGYDTFYQRTAVAYTLVPEKFLKFAKMIIRWNKSYIVYSIKFASFAFSKAWKKRYKTLTILSFLSDILSTLTGLGGAVMFFIMFFMNMNIWLQAFISIPLVTAILMLLYVKLEKVEDIFCGVLYAYFWVFILIWTLPYSLLKLKENSKWLTR